jgi:hypothetical protein
MTTNSVKCPYCENVFQSTTNEPLLFQLKFFGWICCSNCGLFLKVNLDPSGTFPLSVRSIEKYTAPVNFGLLCAKKFNRAYPYSEPPIPEPTCEELKRIMFGIRVNTVPDPANPSAKVFKNLESKKWVLEQLMPKIIPIYNDYPFQMYKIMESVGFNLLLAPYTIQCDYCGIAIPKTREYNCPFCEIEKIHFPNSVQNMKRKEA